MPCCLITRDNYVADVDDPFNVEETRYPCIDSGDYNCMGFAMLTFTWMHPLFTHCDFESLCDDCREDEADECQDLAMFNIELNCYDELEEEDERNDIYYDHNFSNKIAMKLAIENMLAHFKDLRRVDSFDKLKEGEYGIAYATGFYDFHFVTYFPKYGYFSKNGRREIEKVDTLEDGFGERYDSERILFARPIPKNLAMNF